jgi:hypothetical protein
MNETISLLLATTILALGGLGLYMFKSSDENQKGGDEEYNEDGLFGGESLFNWTRQSDSKEDEVEEIANGDEDDFKPRRRGGKTQRNRKASGNSRRRYY